jgi:hypothetical protein
MLGIYRVAAQLVASRVVLSSTELVSYTIIIVIVLVLSSVFFTTCFGLVGHHQTSGFLSFMETALLFAIVICPPLVYMGLCFCLFSPILLMPGCDNIKKTQSENVILLVAVINGNAFRFINLSYDMIKISG